MAEPIAILDGKVVDASQAAISVGDAGFVHGAAVAEMVRTFQHQPFRLEDHLARLRRGIAALGISDAPSDETFHEAVARVVEENTRPLSPLHELGVIVFVTAGLNPTYFDVDALAQAPGCTWGVHSFELPFERWVGKISTGQALLTTSRHAIAPECLDPTIKWRSRAHWFLMDRDARAVDPQAMAIAVNSDGFLTETSSANLLLVKNGGLRSPRAEYTLDGVSRRVARELAEQIGIRWEWADIIPDEPAEADEIILSSTPYCLLPVSSFNGRPVGGSSRPVYDRLVQAWNERVGTDIIEQIRVVAAQRQSR